MDAAPGRGLLRFPGARAGRAEEAKLPAVGPSVLLPCPGGLDGSSPHLLQQEPRGLLGDPEGMVKRAKEGVRAHLGCRPSELRTPPPPPPQASLQREQKGLVSRRPREQPCPDSGKAAGRGGRARPCGVESGSSSGDRSPLKPRGRAARRLPTRPSLVGCVRFCGKTGGCVSVPISLALEGIGPSWLKSAKLLYVRSLPFQICRVC